MKYILLPTLYYIWYITTRIVIIFFAIYLKVAYFLITFILVILTILWDFNIDSLVYFKYWYEEPFFKDRYFNEVKYWQYNTFIDCLKDNKKYID